MVRDNFERVIDHLILNESGSKSYRSPTSEGIWGYVKDKYDRGGSTIHGVTFRSWKRFLNKNKRHDFLTTNERWFDFVRPDERGREFFDVNLFKLNHFKALNPADVRFFYHNEYWQKSGCDFLPSGLDYYVFDFAVHSGVSRSVKYLQGCVGVIQDGVVGDRTISAVLEYIDHNGIRRLLKEIEKDRRKFLSQIKNAFRFQKGWDRRLDSVNEKCYELIDEIYVAPKKDLSKSRTIKTAKTQAKIAAAGAIIPAIAPDQRHIENAIEVAVDNLEAVSMITRLVDTIYSYGQTALLLSIIGFAGYQVYLRYDDWFKRER